MTIDRATLNVAANGRVVIPAAMREKLGIPAGGKIVARLENGVLTLESRKAALRRVREMLAKYDNGVSMADELIAERRAEAERE
jgi:AbrB family looped-hinge helix DNA binding protein